MKKFAAFSIIFMFSFSLISAEETPYTNYSFARLSYVKGNIYIQRAADLGYEEGVVNAPISEGDRLGSTEGRAEIYLGKRNYLRLDNNTKIDFLNLPKRGYDLIRIRVWSGNIYLNVNFLEKEKNVEIHTSDVSTYILDKGIYRMDVRENRETEIFVFDGLVEAAGEEGSVLIKSEQRLEFVGGRPTSAPTQFYAAAEDSFDRWNEYRDTQISKRIAKRYLPEELEDFEYELASYGSWAYLPPYGNVWVPRGLTPGWRPYYYGRWTWLPLCGWCWIPYDPWGWSTFHYGRWHWHTGLGWYWIPTSYWGPGWVSWYWGYDYLYWAPLSYWGYPVVVIDGRFYGRYNGRYYPYNSRAITVIHKNQLRAKNVPKVALSQESIKNLGKFNLSKKALNLKPTAKEITIEKLGDKKFILNKEHRLSEATQRGLERSGKPVSSEQKRMEEKRTYSSSLSKSGEAIRGKTEERIGVGKKISEEKTVQREDKGYIKGGSYGYPPSPKISIKNVPRSYTSKKSSSFLSRIYKHITGSSGSKYIRGSSSRSTSKGSSSKVSSGSRSGSKTSSSGQTSSGRSSSSSGRSGSVKKKN